LFNNKPYIEVNREERFYCALLAHALLACESIRNSFIIKVSEKLSTNLVSKVKVKSDEFQIFLEISALRDFWSNLGDTKHYNEGTHKRRQAVLKDILASQKISDSVIDDIDNVFFKTVNGKIVSPGRWSNQAIEKSNLSKKLKVKLLAIKWAFNAKPDIMIILSKNKVILMIEAKVESREGKDGDSGYQQLETQKFVCDLLKTLAPQYRDFRFENMLLSKKKDAKYNFITWQEIIKLIKESEIDDFTKNCFDSDVFLSPANAY
jgi:hypothetical protein